MDETGEAEWTEAYYAHIDEKYVSQMDQDSATLTYIYIIAAGLLEVKDFINYFYYDPPKDLLLLTKKSTGNTTNP